jgi:hypothetical protein
MEDEMFPEGKIEIRFSDLVGVLAAQSRKINEMRNYENDSVV